MDHAELHQFLFWTFASVTGLCAIAVVVTQNIVRAATWLLFTLGGASAIFFLLGADLVGATQLLVYVGGTLVLVVFGVMLTAQGPFISMKAGSAEWAISAVVGVLFLGVLTMSVLNVGRLGPPDIGPPGGRFNESALTVYGPDKRLSDDPASAQYSAVIGQGFLGVGVGPAHREGKGFKQRTIRAHYLLPFEIVSVHLLVVLIGAAYLARAKRRRRVEA
jgi:NADH-quinone oxidoreductase subunit J